MTLATLDLTKQAPRSPRLRIGGYAILARAIDKCRADLSGSIGDFHTNCPLDKMLLDWKKVDYAAFREKVANGADDGTIANWLTGHGEARTPEQIEQWSDGVEEARPYEDPEKRDWFIGECEPLGLDPKTTTLFDYLDADDRAAFGALKS